MNNDSEQINARREISQRLLAVAGQMREVGALMEYFGGFGEMGKHGREMTGAAQLAEQWAEGIENEDAHPPHRQCGCIYCKPEFEE